MTKWITGPSIKPKVVYHTDSDCYHMRNSNGYREVTEAEIEYHELEECSCCKGEYKSVGGFNDWHKWQQEIQNKA
mgnify:CR=1 FL=1